jgi:hypothetical protein
MSEDKPLNIRVAEALGWRYVPSMGRWAVPGAPAISNMPTDVPRYDTDWAATGPLIEKYEITLVPNRRSVYDTPPWWVAGDAVSGGEVVSAPTPLAAVCNLILTLHQAGKLPQ